MTISGERTKQLDIFCRVTGLTSDFLSFIVVGHFGSFTEPFNYLRQEGYVFTSVCQSVRFPVKWIAQDLLIKSL